MRTAAMYGEGPSHKCRRKRNTFRLRWWEAARVTVIRHSPHRGAHRYALRLYYLCDVEHPSASSCSRGAGRGISRFSGGLDTIARPSTGCASAAASPSPTRPTSRAARRQAGLTTRSRARLLTIRARAELRLIECRAQIVDRRAIAALQCGAVPHLPTARPAVLQRRRRSAARVTGHDARLGDAGRRRRRLGRRQHLQGHDIERLLPLRPPGEPQAAHLQAVAGPRTSSPKLARPRRRCRLYLGGAGLEYKMSADKAYSTDLKHPRRHPRGPRTSSSSTKGVSIVNPDSWALASWRDDVAVKAELVSVRFERASRWPINGQPFPTPLALSWKANAIGGRPPGPFPRPDREPHHSEAKSRASTKPPVWRSSTSPTSGSSRHPQRGHHRPVPRERPPPRPPASIRAGCSTPQALMLRETGPALGGTRGERRG